MKLFSLIACKLKYWDVIVTERPRVGWAGYKRDPKGEGLHILSSKEERKREHWEYFFSIERRERKNRERRAQGGLVALRCSQRKRKS